MISNKKEAPITNLIIEFLKDFVKKAVKTITCGREKEFTSWKTIEEELNTNMYFVNPCYFDKGINEKSKLFSFISNISVNFG